MSLKKISIIEVICSVCLSVSGQALIFDVKCKTGFLGYGLGGGVKRKMFFGY